MGKTWRELTGGIMGNNPPNIMGALRIGGREYTQNADGTFDEVVKSNTVNDAPSTPVITPPTDTSGDDLLSNLLGIK